MNEADLTRRIADLSPEKLARLRQRLNQEPQYERAERIPAVPRDGQPFPLSFAQERLWFLDQLIAQLGLDRVAYNLPLALRLNGMLDLQALRHAFDALVARHETLRTTFLMRDGLPYQQIAPAQSAIHPSEGAQTPRAIDSNDHRRRGVQLNALPMEGTETQRSADSNDDQRRGAQLNALDLRSWPEPARAAEVEQLIANEARQPFDLAAGPLLRITLLRLAEQEHILLLTIHHIVSDGWSAGVLIRELAALYQAALAGRPPALPPLPIQYADYAIWQRARLEGPAREALLGYWRAQLAGLPTLDLPTDRPRPPAQSFCGATQPIALSAQVSAGLRELSRTTGTTLFMTLLGAFAALLGRYSRQEDIVVGTPIAQRTRAETEGLIGFFVNTLVLRADLSGSPAGRDLLARVRRMTLDAYDHQDLPFELLVEALQPARDLGRNPLFQVMFALQNTPLVRIEAPGLMLAPLDLPQTTARFDLSLLLGESAEGITGVIEYSTDLFEAATIARMAGHFTTLLAGLLARPDQPLATLPLLTEAEQHTIAAWNATSIPFPDTFCLHTLFEQQVERTPDAPAVHFEGRQLSYRELNQRANQLAYHLRTLGAGPDRVVGVCLERSLDLLVALYAVLKAGAAYLPLDPSYPVERLAVVLAEARPVVLLTQLEIRDWRLEIRGSEQSLISNLQSPTILYLDHDWPTIAQASTTNPESGVTAENLAYVIYTSGSTGTPKGAMNSHRAIVNRLLWMQERYRLDRRDVVLHKTPFSFDVSVWELFWPLLTGAGLVVARPEGHKDPTYLVETCAAQRVTTLHFVPSMLHVFLEQPSLANCSSLRRVICSGEALPLALEQRFFERLSGVELHNLYGPTEAAVDVSAWACSPQDAHGRSVPIGRPIANIQIYLLDRHEQQVPIGVPGELYIGGVGVGRGYLGRPDLTAERFIPNPFADQRLEIRDWRLGGADEVISNLQSLISKGNRLYKTGDLARYREDGAIEYLGRLDHQVKLRGFRIELGEIEALLVRHAAVREAVVLAREDAPGDLRLVAYVVPQAGQQPRVDELRATLSLHLPDYMIPAAFVLLEALPLSPNGKVDRRALPAPETTRVELGTAFVEPLTPIELELAAIWCDLLRIERVGIYDNFFELGGHSLLATQVLSRIHVTFQVDLPLQVLFTSFTIAELAKQIAQYQIQPAGADNLAALLSQIDQLSDAEVEALLMNTNLLT